MRYHDRLGGRTIANGAWLAPAFRGMHRVLRNDALCVSFYGWSRADAFLAAARAAGFRAAGHIVFRKRYASSVRFLRYEHEQAFLLAKGDPPLPVAPPLDVIDNWRYTGNPCCRSMKLRDQRWPRLRPGEWPPQTDIMIRVIDSMPETQGLQEPIPLLEVRRVDTSRHTIVSIDEVLFARTYQGRADRQPPDYTLDYTLDEIQRVVTALTRRPGKFRITIDLQASLVQNFLDFFSTTVLYRGSGVTFKPATNVEIEVRPVAEPEEEPRVNDQDDNQHRPRTGAERAALAERLGVPSFQEALQRAADNRIKSLDPESRKPATVEEHRGAGLSITIPRF